MITLGGAAGAILALFLGRILWRRAVRRRAAQRILVEALNSASELDRAAAVRVLIEQGISEHASLIWRMLSRGELDAPARRALAAGIAHRSWEPVVSRDAERLRLWAAQENGAYHETSDARPVP